MPNQRLFFHVFGLLLRQALDLKSSDLKTLGDQFGDLRRMKAAYFKTHVLTTFCYISTTSMTKRIVRLLSVKVVNLTKGEVADFLLEEGMLNHYPFLLDVVSGTRRLLVDESFADGMPICFQRFPFVLGSRFVYLTQAIHKKEERKKIHDQFKGQWCIYIPGSFWPNTKTS